MCFFIIARLKMQVYLCNCRFVTALKSYRVNTLFRDYRKSLSRSHSRSLSLARSRSRSPPSLYLIIILLHWCWAHVETTLKRCCATLKNRCIDVVQRWFKVVSMLDTGVVSPLFNIVHCSPLFKFDVPLTLTARMKEPETMTTITIVIVPTRRLLKWSKR